MPTKFLKKDIYQVWLTARDESDELYKSDILLTTSENGLKFLFTLFKLLKSETRSFLPVSDFNKKNEFETIIAILFQEFISYPSLEENGTVRGDITELIESLKKKPEYIVEYFQKQITYLRKERIEFWEKVKKRYLESSEIFDETLLRRRGERNLILGRVSDRNQEF
ncbi:hypothetical protein LCGC14_0957650 [marine sediment metagenome]|uniref:Uncharacterized protein n=1 Tax=marine sediment metagenome TaxID=412755 RepID=A0A0F9P1H7_9ZZZZ|nr:MAG: hypothetical protein Lokiarch_22640 [Candidatus Lokiarchaeum sp. GC14_75]